MPRTDDLLLQFNLERSSSDIERYRYRGSLEKQILGLVVYLSIFGLARPYLIRMSGHGHILEAYVPNLDLIANVVGYSMGPFGWGLFESLYNPDQDSFSSIIINYIALLGIAYIVATQTLKTKSLAEGWSRTFIMFLITYLIPGKWLSYFLYLLGRSITDFAPIGTFLNWALTVTGGFVFIFIVLSFEAFLISEFGRYAARLANYIHKKRG